MPRTSKTSTPAAKELPKFTVPSGQVTIRALLESAQNGDEMKTLLRVLKEALCKDQDFETAAMIRKIEQAARQSPIVLESPR